MQVALSLVAAAFGYSGDDDDGGGGGLDGGRANMLPKSEMPEQAQDNAPADWEGGTRICMPEELAIATRYLPISAALGSVPRSTAPSTGKRLYIYLDSTCGPIYVRSWKSSCI